MAAMLVLAGCRQDMQDQPKFFPQRGTDFYADGRSVRPQVENTVARNQLHEDSYFYTGLVDGKEGDGMPFPVTMAGARARAGAIQRVLHAVPLARGQWRRDDRPARIYEGGEFPYGAAGDGSAGTLLPRDHEWLWRDAGLCGADDAGGSLGDCGLHQGAAVEPEGDAGRCAGGPAMFEPLASIAEKQGLPASFADEWTLPPTAVTGTPDDGLYVLPATRSRWNGERRCGTSARRLNRLRPAPAGQTVPKQ